MTFIGQHRAPHVKTRRMNYKFTLKGHIENLTSGLGHDLIGKRSCCILIDPYHQPEHIYGVFIALVCLSKAVAEKLLVTIHDLK